MEEILASIRRIISEDDPPAEGAEEAVAAPAPAAEAPAEEPAPAPIAYDEPAEDEDVLELTDRVDPPEPSFESVGDLDVFPAPAPAPAAAVAPPQPAYEPPAYTPPLSDDSLVSPPAAASAASAFASLSQSIAMPQEGRTLEDVVRELLRPLLKQWLDENLPRIVEGAVQAEVQRIARGHGG